MALTLKTANGLCGAKTRKTGEPCKAAALKPGGRCRVHAGLSTGPRTLMGKWLSLSRLTQFRKGWRPDLPLPPGAPAWWRTTDLAPTDTHPTTDEPKPLKGKGK